ncbi:phosphatidylserine decarboxylase family protein [Candidatus Methylacidiphilum fumarolicum]|uniref:Phosphatidylserine decarboxylase proenzyme n=2 Tax=Candidatus Methylacidiphilum fumarolicum TaxID=591154 RepID=I0K1D7_METFB|nr:phosphatidylserine decarboxylase family protein [Candidatus Methylacidiphilum fumarolicum]MBW6414938.1 phosphatidylserine decarboxylase family protein [Candidatus Methylacidiphilum fumarolicum]TFE70370.1 phosphatidylserine decarboxylase [Candidatus Methylacidiphilum fumarolicum]TFE73950.1 phosphatidylserine decarboxylase family protein [Candidatus Methylacidiphilum fumarolicum]TFE74456.1 phosphatidylserine decarboxylase family protein [Candidatus Methylacidiphilum fumarolicum]TFE77883.1 pho
MKDSLLFREAFPIAFTMAMLSLIFLLLPFKPAKFVGVFFLLALLFLFYFFRNPERTIPTDPHYILAPADGKIVEIKVEEKSPFYEGKTTKISIFLSIFDVHVNRSPVDGKIIKKEYHKGIFLDARNPKASLLNERQDWWIQSTKGCIVGIRQIAGFIARRLVSWKETGDTIKMGERIGMIKFGSRTELYLPSDCIVVVQNGEKVEAGKTVVAKWP